MRRKGVQSIEDVQSALDDEVLPGRILGRRDSMMRRSELLPDGGIEEMPALVGIVPFFVSCFCWGRRRLGGLPPAQIPRLPEQHVEGLVCAGQGHSTGLGAGGQTQQRSDGKERHELPFEQVGWKGMSAEWHVLRCLRWSVVCASFAIKLKLIGIPIWQYQSALRQIPNSELPRAFITESAFMQRSRHQRSVRWWAGPDLGGKSSPTWKTAQPKSAGEVASST